MGRPLFSVVIPTIGRPTLRGTLLSIRGQASEAVAEIIVVVDTCGELESDVFGLCRELGVYAIPFDAGCHDTGSPQLHVGYMRARGEYVLNIGDDDMYEPGAFDLIAEAVDTGDPGPLMFKAELHPAPHRANREPVVLWDEPIIAEGHVTGQGFVCPNDPRRMGRWVNDWTFMRETVALHGGRVEWREELIARCY